MILSAAIVDKDGAIYVARQYCEMTKSKVEALYMTFSRLITKGKQHTIIETEEVRYVYQSIGDFYNVLITDKHSNIIEDIKTLGLFVRAINEFASNGRGPINEDIINQNSLTLLFVFDEIISMGFRQIDDVGQLRTIMLMKSQEENAHMESLTKKERKAKAKAAEKSKELDQQRRNEMLRQFDRMTNVNFSSNISSESKITEPVVEVDHKKFNPKAHFYDDSGNLRIRAYVARIDKTKRPRHADSNSISAKLSTSQYFSMSDLRQTTCSLSEHEIQHYRLVEPSRCPNPNRTKRARTAQRRILLLTPTSVIHVDSQSERLNETISERDIIREQLDRYVPKATRVATANACRQYPRLATKRIYDRYAHLFGLVPNSKLPY